MKFSRSALLALLLMVLAAVLTYWSIHQLATLNTQALGGLPAPDTAAGQPLATAATVARWLALGALAFFVAPRRSLTGWIVLSMLGCI